MQDGGHGEQYAFPIATPRLVMRGTEAQDGPVLDGLAANPAIAPNLCASLPAEAARTLAVVERRTGRIVGAGGCGGSGLGSGVEISLWIGEPYWGRGYGTEAAHALIDHAFDDRCVNAIWCANRVTNTRARRVIEKCGFQFRGSGMVRLPGRGAEPIERFALDRRNWLSLKAWGAAHGEGDAGNAPHETAA